MKEKYFSELNEFYQKVSRKAEQVLKFLFSKISICIIKIPVLLLTYLNILFWFKICSYAGLDLNQHSVKLLEIISRR